MILTDASECNHEDWAAAVTEADVNSRVRRKILSSAESDSEWHDIHNAEILFCESVKQQSWFQWWTELNDQVDATE